MYGSFLHSLSLQFNSIQLNSIQFPINKGKQMFRNVENNLGSHV